MLVLWFAMGIWHGSSWKYALGEGLWFWLLIVMGQCLEPVTKKLVQVLHINTDNVGWHIFQSVRTFLCFSVGMVFFRASSIGASFDLIRLGFTRLGAEVVLFKFYSPHTVIMIVLGLMLVFVMDMLKYRGISTRDVLAGQNIVVRWICLYAMILLLILEFINKIGIETGAFIYGQF